MALEELFNQQARRETETTEHAMTAVDSLPILLRAVIGRIFENEGEFLLKFAPEAEPNFELYECHMASDQTRIAFVSGSGFDNPGVTPKILPTADVIEWVQMTHNAEAQLPPEQA